MRQDETDGQIASTNDKDTAMSDATSNTGTHTNEAQFLAPRTLQQAGGNEAYGAEIHRYVSETRGGLVSVRADGVTLFRSVGEDWRVLSRKKPECPYEQWLATKTRGYAELASWKREVQELPSVEQVEEWITDGVCETPTGHCVEPDGTGPDGVPSWLCVLGLL